MRKSKIRSIHNTPVLTPCPIVLKDKIIKELNLKLIEANSGNYIIQIQSIGDLEKTWIDYEYHSDVKIIISDRNNIDRAEGVTVPGFGSKPIPLNQKYKLHTSSFFTWDLFEDQLFEKVLRAQTTINNEGYYPKIK